MGIAVGVVGRGYGRSVLVPAFRADTRCEIVGIAATDGEHARLAAAEAGIERAFADWRAMVKDRSIDAVVVATPPFAQPEIVLSALQQGKAVFAEKPMALNLADAEAMTNCALSSNRPNMIDFNFTEIGVWKQARKILAEGGIGAVRHVAVQWNTESYANRMRLANWKSSSSQGGGALFNFVSHSLHYVEWFAGPVTGLCSSLFRMPGDNRSGDTTVVMALSFRSGAAGSLSMSAAAYLGSGHRLEFYGDEGTLVLENTTSDYMKGFRLLYGKRPQAQLEPITADDPDEGRYADGRILAASRLASRFLDWMEKGTAARPDFRDGLRVQRLLGAARDSDEKRCWVTVSD